LQPGIRIIQPKKHLPRFHPIALLHENLLYGRWHWGICLKVVQGLDLTVGGDAGSDRFAFGLTHSNRYLGTMEGDESSEHHDRHNHADYDKSGSLSIHGTKAVIRCGYHFCSKL
jgi:hypothetical protein